MAEVADFLYDVEDNVLDTLVKGTPAFVFIIDVGLKMFQVPEGMAEAPVLLSLKCVRQWIRNYICSSSSCYCALIFLATKKDNNAMNSKHIFNVFTLKRPEADVILAIDKFITLVEENQFQDEYGCADFCLAEALWIASSLLFEQKGKTTKRVILFTNEENPFPNRQERRRVIAKAADMNNSKINFQLIPFGASCDTEQYREIRDMGEGWDSQDWSPVTDLDGILKRCIMPKPYHVPMANIPLYISDELYLPVNIHNLVKEVKIPFHVYLSKDTNEPVTSKVVTRHADEEGMDVEGPSGTSSLADPLQVNTPHSYIHYENIRGLDIEFTKEEMVKINAIGERRLKLLGFKPRSSLSLELHLQPSSFIYPSEKIAEGATALFTGLLQRCLAKGVVAICTYCPRPTSTVRFVALAPQTEVISKDLVQISPPGFLMIYLPFGDEVRDLEAECMQTENASREQVEIMMKVVKKLRFPFSPLDFPNPKLSAHWCAVEALAFNKNEPDPFDDPTRIDHERLRARLQNLPEEVNQSIYSKDYRVPQNMSRLKPTPDNILQVIADVEENYRNDTLGRLKSDQLKGYLKHVGLGKGLSSLYKAALIERVTKYLNKNS